MPNEKCVDALKSTKDQYKAIGISTTHLSEVDKELLSSLAANNECGMVMERDHGWLIKLYDEKAYNDHGASESLKAIFDTSLEAGFRLIEFDGAAEVYECFTCHPQP